MRFFVPALVVVSGFSLLPAGPAAAQIEIFPTPGLNWTVNPAFGQAGEGRDNVSGATCLAIPVVARTSCLVVNDSTRFAQFFTVSGTTIRSGPFVGVTPGAPAGTLAFNPNMEGAANDGRSFYVVTSRGGTGTPAAPDPTFLVARFTAEAAASQTTVPFASTPTPAGLQVSDRLRAALTAGIAVPGLANEQLNKTNAEIEGIAVRQRTRGDSVVHLGFRAPVLGGKAFIVSVPAGNLFATSGALTPTVTGLALGGPNIGIRDLAAASDGVLILAGPGRGVTARASLFHWSDETGQLKLLGVIAEPANRNAEALVVLDDDPEFVRFLLMFDGVANGGPLEYFVSR